MLFKKLLMTTAAFALTTAIQAGDALKAVKNSKPNIVYILADDLGYNELGCYGQTKILTPNIDTLANEGVKFTQHYSGSPVCAPSRGTLMTGYHTGHGFVRGNKDHYIKTADKKRSRTGQEPLPDETVTLPELLKTAGYKTGVIGKWGLGGFNTSGHPNKQGVDHFFGYLDQWNAHNYYPPFLARNGEKVKLNNPVFRAHQRFPKDLDKNDPANYKKYQGSDFAPDLMIEEAVKFIKDNKDERFFLYYASPIPHVSVQVPDKWLDKYKGKFEETPYLGEKGYLPHRYPRACYAAMVSHLDWEVGRIMKEIKAHGLDDNTIIVFASDNGPTFNGGSDSKFFNSAGPLKGLKCSVLEGGIRIPHIARWPKKIKGGGVSDHISAFWDFLPTACELAGVAIPEGIDGRSYLPTLIGQSQHNLKERVLYWEDARVKQAARKGDWKIVIPFVTQQAELYNLKDDIGEKVNLKDKFPEKYQEMLKLLSSERTKSVDFPLISKEAWAEKQRLRRERSKKK